MNLDGKGFYIAVVIFCVLFLVVGNRLARGEPRVDEFEDYWGFYSGTVTEIIEHDHSIDAWGGERTLIRFYVRIRDGGMRGETVEALQRIDSFEIVSRREVSVGDRVLLDYSEWEGVYNFFDYVRINYIVLLGVAFLALVVIFGRKKGFSAIVALGFTCAAVFWVFLPAILAGGNIYAMTILVCAFAIVSTLLLIIGANRKAYSAMLGCLGGVFFASVLMVAMDRIMQLTGALDRETEWLVLLDNPLDLRAIIFAGVILGAVGAIMDVAMSISSSLWELKEAGGVKDFRAIFASGVNIGRDILGTMMNTLILAYIGSSLSLILLIMANDPPLLRVLNLEMILAEFLRALIGSFGMLLTIPLTAAICGWFYEFTYDDHGEIDVDAYFGAKKSKRDGGTNG